jgi:hypothetical protein
MATCNKLHTEEPQILGATVKTFIPPRELAPGICAPLYFPVSFTSMRNNRLKIFHYNDNNANSLF